MTLATVAFWIFWSAPGREPGDSSNPPPPALEAKINEEGEVQVMVEPQGSFSPGSTLDFKITLETHSVELSQDLLEVSKLAIDGKDVYSPIAWEGSPAGGHHRNGTLKFSPVKSSFQTIELQIMGIGGVDRTFRWEF